MLDALSLRRATRAVRALLIVLAAYGAALAVSAGIALTLGEDVPTPPSAATATPASGVGASAIDPATLSYAPIFERNLFGSEPLEAPSGGPAATVTGHADLILRGTASIDGRGFAVFEQRDGGKQDVFAIGEQVFGGPELVSVQETTAVVTTGGRRVTLEITEEKDDERVKGKQAAAAAPDGSGIRRTGDGTYVVDRREVEHSIENLSTVITKMRAVPYLKDGESLGFRVFNIRPGSIFERMGLRNGDVIQNVNGTELKDPQRALMLLDTVASASEIRVDLLRGQQPTSLMYTIR